jgi:nitronate monooxygenase
MLWNLTTPIFQAPTGSLAGPELCAAVSAAGGMGAMGLTWTTPEEAAVLIRDVRARTDRPFQVNFALHFPPNALSAVLDAGAPFITFSWGDPAPYLPMVRAAGAKVGIQVTNAGGARRAIDLGVDFLICQGVEAGGHVQSSTPLLVLLPGVVEAAGSVPVIAAGGIADGAGIAEVVHLGATGALLGTRFLATVESRAHPDYKVALVRASAADTALTVCFDGGWPYSPQRVLRNVTLETWEAAGSPPVGQRPGEGDVVARTEPGEPIYRYEGPAPKIGMTGDIAAMCLYAGTGCGRITDIPTAAEVIARLMQEYQII